MKLYILRWNPTFSMSYDYFNSMMEYIKVHPIDDFNWSIYDHEDLESGDMFILAQVGTGDKDGIAGFGLFNTDPYTAPNWKANDGTNRFYADMSLHCLISHNYTEAYKDYEPLFSAKELEEKFPDVDWHKGHAGVLIPKDTVEPLVLYLMKKTLPLSKPDENIAFNMRRRKSSLGSYFAQYINGLCPNFKQKVIESGKLVYENFDEGDFVDKSLIEVSTKKFNKVKFSAESTEDDFVKFFIPVA